MRRLSTFSSTFSTAALRAMIWGSNLLSARREGQGLVEYGLILVLIMVVCVGILSVVGGKVSNVYYTKLINNGAW
jgi:pilus assembly protein Flp/PilA